MPSRGGGRTRLTGDARAILTVQALRAFAYGLGSVVIGVSLARSGRSAPEVGAVLAALLAGSALASIALARIADRAGRRRCYTTLLLIMAGAGSVFALTDSTVALLLAALSGTVSTEVVESGPFTTLEQTMLASYASGGHDRTRLYGTYNAIATLSGSLGALAAGGPQLLHTWLPSIPSSQRWLLAYPVVALAALPFAMRLSTAVEVEGEPGHPRLGRSRATVARLAALFAVDSFGGGFVTQSFVAFWFARRYGTSPEVLGLVFFSIGLLQAASFKIAVRLAARGGLLRTMVFTHLPSNVLLGAIAFAPSFAAALGLLLARFTLSQMDVPTRQAYVAAVVDPEERTAAAAYTNAARYAVRPAGPLLGGALATISLGAPFLAAGIVKGAYDLGLYAIFRRTPLDGEGRAREAGSR